MTYFNLLGEMHSEDDWADYEGISDKFQNFLARATNCQSVLDLSAASTIASTSSSADQDTRTRQVILLEDLPNILHLPTRDMFHAALDGVVNDNNSTSSPIIIIISDAGLRGEGDPDDIGSSSWKNKSKDTLDIRTALPHTLIRSPYVTQVGRVDLVCSKTRYTNHAR